MHPIRRPALLALALATLALPALAGDPAVGENEFKKCKACHAITAPDGTAIQKGGKTGPDLYGIVGSQIGVVEGFTFGPDLVAAGADGSTWDEASLAAYVTDPVAWLKEKTGNPAAKSKMTFKLRAKSEDVAAYLASVVQ